MKAPNEKKKGGGKIIEDDEDKQSAFLYLPQIKLKGDDNSPLTQWTAFANPVESLEDAQDIVEERVRSDAEYRAKYEIITYPF